MILFQEVIEDFQIIKSYIVLNKISNLFKILFVVSQGWQGWKLWHLLLESYIIVRMQ